jgi:acylphosphatase
MLNVYHFDAKGLTLGAVVVVVAGNEKTATKKAKEWLEKSGLDPETIKLEHVEPFKSPMVVFACDGDY